MNPSVIDLATRVHNHNFRIDPIVRSLLDTDFYKFLMQQFIWEQDYRDISVTFTVTNRTRTARLAEQIDESELRAQLDHVRELRFSRSELVWLQGNTFYGTRGIFSPNFVEWLGRFRLPEYELRRTDDGQLELRFAGPWAEVTLWEIPALAIINELRARRAMRSLSRLQLDILYARAKTRLWSKIERLRRLQLLNISDFGTRRRHGFLWQEWVVVAMRDALGPALSGTSNAHLAMKHDLEAIGTNAHELQMVVAALAASDQELAGSPYEVLRRWAQTYHGALLVLLPDTYGTTSFLARAPEWVAEWTGARVDSKEPVEGGEEMIAWWRSRGQDPREKLLLFSDGLDIDAIEMLHARFLGQVRLGFGWGTLLTNDFRGCQPSATALPGLEPISIVCKVTQAGGRPVVKLSDNLRKATGPAAEIERYLRVFGSPGGTEREVVV